MWYNEKYYKLKLHMNYQIVQAEKEVFQNEMSDLVRQGFVPLGAPQVMQTAPLVLMQALYKPV